MSTESQWFVMQGEEQLGPYTGAQLVEFASGGNILRETLVWAEGMESWLPAGQIEGVFPAAEASPGTMTGPAPANEPAGPYPSPEVGNGLFGMWVGLLLGGLALIVVGFLLVGILSRNASPDTGQELSTGEVTGVMIAGILGMLGYLVMILSFIPFYITLFRSWKCLQPGGLARTSPGQAIGFLFIPFFNLYWMFQALRGLATDWNTTVETYPDLKAAPKLSGGVFLTCCIGMFIQPIGIIMMFPVMAQMTKGVNFFAFRPHQHAPGQVGFTLR